MIYATHVMEERHNINFDFKVLDTQKIQLNLSI